MSTGTLAQITSKNTPSSSTHPLGDIEHMFTTLVSHPDIKYIAAIVDENKKLRRDYDDLERDNEHTLKQVARLQTSLDAAREEGEDASKRLQSALKEKQALDSQYLQAKKKIADNEKEIGEEKTRLQQQIDSVKQELKQERDSLQRLSAFSCKLVSISGDYEHICGILNSIRISAIHLAEAYLCDDLPLEGINWSSIKSHIALSGTDRIFPLPVSNSPIAKHMRVAAFMTILGYELRDHIFQPLYLLQNSAEFTNFLDDLANRDEEAEAHLRSVLLRVLTAEFKDLEDSIGTKRRQAVIQTVKKCFGSLVIEAKRDTFILELEAYCERARKEWEYIQKLERRVDFETEPENEDLAQKKLWLPLGTKPWSSAGSPHSKSQGNATSKNTGQGSKKDVSSGPASPRSPGEAASLLDFVVVWPAATVVMVDGSTVILSLGYFLAASEIATAKMEQKELPASRDQYRAAREGKRKSRQSFGENGSAMARSGSFLPAQAGSGSKKS